jgi:hypothetical protein
VWSSTSVEVRSSSGVEAGMVGGGNGGESLWRRGAEGHWPLEGGGGDSSSSRGDLLVEKKRKERGMRGGRRLVASILVHKF